MLYFNVLEMTSFRITHTINLSCYQVQRCIVRERVLELLSAFISPSQAHRGEGLSGKKSTMTNHRSRRAPQAKGNLPLHENNRWDMSSLRKSLEPKKPIFPVKNAIGRRHNSLPTATTLTLSSSKTLTLAKLYPITLVEAVSREEAMSLCHACHKPDSMLQVTLDRIGVYSSGIENSTSNIKSINGYKVVVKAHDKTYTSISVTDTKSEQLYSVVLELSKELGTSQTNRLLEVFDKHIAVGFAEWLGGASGWRFDCPKGDRPTSWKRQYVLQLNTLQSVFTLFAPPAQKYFFVGEMKKMTWCKQDELTDHVSSIRVWIETIPRTNLSQRLLRTSTFGPESPVHWAHHHPLTNYPLTVVTSSSMSELTTGVIGLFQREFGHTASDPLGSRWRNHPKRRTTDWKEAGKINSEWTEDHLEALLNDEHKNIICNNSGRWEGLV